MAAYSPQTLFLAIETSQRAASAALRDRAGTVHEEPLSQRKRHDDDLMPAIDRLFARTGLKPADLRGGTVAVSIGPGGFTGLRIAIATAKMLAETLDVKLIAVPSALVAAEGAEVRGQKSAVSPTERLIALACKGDSFWLTRVRRETASDGWKIVGEAGIANADAFDPLGASAIIADEFFPDAAKQGAENAGVRIIAPVFSAGACLRIGERMLARGETIDPLRMLPLYPRQPEAVTLWGQRESHSTR